MGEECGAAVKLVGSTKLTTSFKTFNSRRTMCPIKIPDCMDLDSCSHFRLNPESLNWRRQSCLDGALMDFKASRKPFVLG